jgi:GTP pyrophosphokinase
MNVSPAIVHVASLSLASGDKPHETAHQTLLRARQFAYPFLSGTPLDTGEDALAHADVVVDILRQIGAGDALLAAVYLGYSVTHLQKPEEILTKAFDASYASLAISTHRLVQLQRSTRAHRPEDLNASLQAAQIERVRKMLLAFSKDLRVVLLRLASRLATLRYHASVRTPMLQNLAQETLQIFSPLANRLGIWQIKWEMEDLAFRFLQPDTYKQIASWLDGKRTEREAFMAQVRQELQFQLQQQGIQATVDGRPKHIYSIWRKMQGKQLSFDRIFDIRALRIVVPTVEDCYSALSFVQERYTPLPEEFDDYIAKPKPNGYQSLHCVVRDTQDRVLEVQIRTPQMHAHAEHGVAAHWAYKEAGAKGYAGVSAVSEDDEQIALARSTVMHQLLAWERETATAASAAEPRLFNDRIYVLTPQSVVIELPAAATPIDFAYALHSELGHRCRGAKVNGQWVQLNTPLLNGQTVEITAVKEGGPSRDWLNPELGYLRSKSAKSKVRAWFNAVAMAQTVAKGRELVEKVLQREGKTAIKLDDLANRLGFKEAAALFEVVGKDEFSLKNIETLLKPPPEAPSEDEILTRRLQVPTAHTGSKAGVLVVGLDSLLTQLAKCCRPAPPDGIQGFVTKGKGVSVHRSTCSNFRQLQSQHPERVIDVQWGGASLHGGYPVDISIEAADRSGLLRDISEVFAKEKMNVIGVNTQSIKHSHGEMAYMTFTVEISDSRKLDRVLSHVGEVSGIKTVKRR